MRSTKKAITRANRAKPLTRPLFGKNMLTDRATKILATALLRNRARPRAGARRRGAGHDEPGRSFKPDVHHRRNDALRDLEAALKAAGAQGTNYQDKSLNGLDLSKLDLHRRQFPRGAHEQDEFRQQQFQRRGARSDLRARRRFFPGRGYFKNAHLFASQMRGAKFDGADLSGARVTADMTHASLRGAKLKGADLSADMKNQSMGLMRAILKSADTTGATSKTPISAATICNTPNLKGANFTGASLAGADASGADLRGAILDHADLAGLDVTSAQIDKAQGGSLRRPRISAAPSANNPRAGAARGGGGGGDGWAGGGSGPRRRVRRRAVLLSRPPPIFADAPTMRSGTPRAGFAPQQDPHYPRTTGLQPQLRRQKVGRQCLSVVNVH